MKKSILLVAGVLTLSSELLLSAPIPGLYNTGVDNAGALLGAGVIDPHYRLVQSADPAAPGPNAFVLDNAWPVAPAGPWLAHGPNSKWLAPQPSQAQGNQAGNYTFRLTFDLTGLDPDTAVITGRWTSDNAGMDILINGASTGITYDGNFGAFSGSWTINRGFVEGTNTLDFVINNAGTTINPIGFRAELSGTVEPLPPPGTPPQVTVPPQSATVFLQDPVSFLVKASGSRPFYYQWRHNGEAIAGATNSSYTISAVRAADAGAYDVIVSNDSGSATSAPATLNTLFASPAQPLREPLGPSNRRSGLAFSEIMYHPLAREDGRNLEFIELYNSNPWPEDLSGWRLAGEVDWTFPSGTIIAGMGFLVAAPSPADIEAVYGISGVVGGFTNGLANGGGILRLVKRSGGIVIDLAYSDQPPWPVAPDGVGHSLVLARPSYGERNPLAWAASAHIGGSPGAVDPEPNAPADFVVLNELLAHTDPPLTDAIELFNAGPFAADLSGCWLTDEPATNKFRIPDGTRLPPQGFVVFAEAQLGFGLSAVGETVYLVNSNLTRVLDAVRFGGQMQGISSGRYPDGAPTWSLLSSFTPGMSNSPVFISPVVINELMFNPISRDSGDEYVELFNRSTLAVNLGGWRLNGGIDFTFPSNTVMAPGAFLVVAKDAARLLVNYSNLNPGNCLGNYGGTLANGGERIVLEMPDTAVSTNSAGRIITNLFYQVINEVSYFDRSRWSRYADGRGSSLELIDAHADTRLAPNWADSDESTKAPWTTIEFTGTVDNAMPSVNADQVQLFLLGPGEALVDDVEVLWNGVNRVPNSTFEAGITGWSFQGTQIRSSWETNGVRCLHLRASERGEPIVNRVRAPLTVTVPGGANVTLRAKVRWLAGCPEFLMRLKGGGVEATTRLAVPSNLGSPGAPNGQALPNVGPIITEATHRPVLPSANLPIRVSARVQDPDGVAGVSLNYRIDPSTAASSIPMRDDGTGGDLIPGDGIFTATLPGQPRDTLIAFFIEAADGADAPARAQFPNNAPARECFIRVGEQWIAGPFANYRIWMPQATLNHWATRGNISNDPLDVTFVYGNARIVYNAGGMYGGSPAWSPSYNSPIGNICAYDVDLPGDDMILGDDKLGLDLPIRDATNQREQLMHWIADQYGIPNLYRRDVHLFVNGYKRGSIYHDTQQPGGDFLEEWFPDDPDGTLLKTTQWSEGDDGGTPQSILLNSLERFTSGGALKTARYRWNWRPRATDSQLDFTNFFSLVDAVNAPTNTYRSAVEGLVNIEDWMRMFAMNDLCSFWDALGNPNSKNTFLYKPAQAAWRLLPWDFDVGLGVFNDPTNDPLFPSNVDPTIKRMYDFSAFVRIYWRELEHGVNTFFQSNAVAPLLAAKDEAYRVYGFTFTSPFVPSGPYSLSVPAWIEQRRAFLRTQLATVAATFAVLGSTNYATNRDVALIRGTAPVSVTALSVNGIPYPAQWANVTGWTLQVPLVPGTNVLLLAGLDRYGQVISNTLRTITVDYTGALTPAEDQVVITEIMYNPLFPESSFIELFNRSTNQTFDLSGWRLNGVGYTFPSGTLLPPQAYLVLVKNRQAFALVYGYGVPVFDEYPGQLDNGGETLTLLRPGQDPGAEVEVDRVFYDDDAPWLARADGGGASLQLIDPDQDNSRVSNWGDGSGWRFFSYTGNLGTLAASRLSLYFVETTGGDVLLDDLSLVGISGPGAGTNLIRNGDFESGQLAPWVAARLASNSVVVSESAHSGQYCLQLLARPGGVSVTDFYQDLVPAAATGTVYRLNFWFKPGTGASNLTVRLNTNFRPVANVGPAPAATPGAANSSYVTLPAYPPLWLSEVQPQNLNGATDNAGEVAPWIELFNAGANVLSLDGYLLANSFTNLAQWTFPAGAVIQPGQYLFVWADGNPGQSAGAQFHTNFRLEPTNGTVVLSRFLDGSSQILDYLNYREVGAGQSFGVEPPAQTAWRQVFYYPTPGQTNNPMAPPVVLFINEWMAANASFMADPADGRYDDWFEIWNPNSEAIDLRGFTLTDDPASPGKHTVTTNIVVPARGFLRVWADEDSTQTDPQGDLHVNFRLSQGGETIQLYDPSGRLVDGVTFGPQTNNISQGRYPDGSASFVFMPTPTPQAPNVSSSCGTIQILDLVLDLPTSATLIWGSSPGCTYRVQYTDHLGSAAWTDLPGDVLADNDTATTTDTTISAATQRFYRVVVVPNNR